MSKITFRADDALVERLDELDASKSEVMREALREFLDRQPGAGGPARGGDDPVAARVDELLNERLDSRDVNVTISLEGADIEDAIVEEGADEAASEDSCQQCGAEVEEAHAFCPNCGEEQPREAQCECGETVDTEWAFCPGCGRRTPTADVFDRA